MKLLYALLSTGLLGSLAAAAPTARATTFWTGPAAVTYGSGIRIYDADPNGIIHEWRETTLGQVATGTRIGYTCRPGTPLSAVSIGNRIYLHYQGPQGGEVQIIYDGNTDNWSQGPGIP